MSGAVGIGARIRGEGVVGIDARAKEAPAGEVPNTCPRPVIAPRGLR